MCNMRVAHELRKLWVLVWGEDIPSPTCPEYEEHHKSIQLILKAIDRLIGQVEEEDI